MSDRDPDDIERSTLDAVVRAYGRKNGLGLSRLTHDEAPWIEARGATPSGGWSNAEISRKRMAEFFTERAIAGESPTRKAEPAPLNEDDLLSIAERQAKRWKGALALLADR